MTSCDKEIINTIDKIKEKNIPLYQAIPRKDFSITFCKEFSSLSKTLEDNGVNDFKVRTTNGFITVQTFNIASTLTYLKIHNDHLHADDFLRGLSTPRDGSFIFGYLLSTQIDDSLLISESIEIHPFKSVEEKLSAVNRSEIQDYLLHTSPEFTMARDNLAVLLIQVPINKMVFELDGDENEFPREFLPGLLVSEKLKEIQELITLVSERNIVILANWGSYSDQRLDYVMGMKPNINRDYYSECDFSFFTSCLTKTDWNESKRIYELTLKSTSSKELKVALDRVYASMSNADFKGKVLDLSVAMEVMCVSGRGDNTYKVSNHIAWLCSADYSVRLEIMKAVKDFYSLRSSIVHEGKYSKTAIKSYGGEENLYNIVLEHVKKALIILLEHGSKPDWNQVVANGGLLK